MAKFTDSLKRDWSIDIDYFAVKQLRKELDVDLLTILDQDAKLLERLAFDEVLLVDVISVLLTDQIKKRDIDERDFAKGLLGDGLQSAMNALVESLSDFFRPPRGPIVRKMWHLINTTHDAAARKTIAKMDSPELKQKLEREIDSQLEKLTT